MRVIDLGHSYALEHLDGNLEELLTFVKREGPKYPGNEGSHPGTILQEVFRACIERVKYVNGQHWHRVNPLILRNLRECIAMLEERAAETHGRRADWRLRESLCEVNDQIEFLPTCRSCGHIGCTAHAADAERNPTTESTHER